jgi:hypothetical protein
MNIDAIELYGLITIAQGKHRIPAGLIMRGIPVVNLSNYAESLLYRYLPVLTNKNTIYSVIVTAKEYW